MHSYKRSQSDTVSVKSGGVGFLGLLAILFIGLKLGGVIAWPWLWVVSPLWIPLAIVLTLLVFFLAACLLAGIVVGVCQVILKRCN